MQHLENYSNELTKELSDPVYAQLVTSLFRKVDQTPDTDENLAAFTKIGMGRLYSMLFDFIFLVSVAH